MQTNEHKEQDGGMWLKNKWPNVRALDHDWTMERYDYPQYVRDWIKNNWVKVNDENGGTYQEPEYYKNRQPLSNDLPSQKIRDLLYESSEDLSDSEDNDSILACKYLSEEEEPKEKENMISYFDSEPSLEIQQGIVGGYITPIYLQDGRIMMVNEEGELKKLPLNKEATSMAQQRIVGRVVVFNNPSNDSISESEEEEDSIPELKKVSEEECNDNEGKYEGDPRAGTASVFYVKTEQPQDGGLKEGQKFAQDYKKTVWAKELMDEPNKKALDVMAKEGASAAANYMMNMAGGDYSRMRSMYG